MEGRLDSEGGEVHYGDGVRGDWMMKGWGVGVEDSMICRSRYGAVPRVSGNGCTLYRFTQHSLDPGVLAEKTNANKLALL